METRVNEPDMPNDNGEGIPVCITCFQPVDPLAHYCSNCGGATGKFTHYLPFINIRWEVSVWGQAWRQMWYREVSLAGRVFRLIMIAWNVPIMLLGLLFRPSRNITKEPDHPSSRAESDPSN
ncbi:hypothetical protein ACFL6U_23010 [Planctomycetota bacterium]